MLLLDRRKLEARRLAAAGPLHPLYESLERELRPLVGAHIYVPASKALLSRAGGCCERDGATLDFDPTSPQAHRCPKCGTIHTGELHHRAWVTSYQLWLAERAVHAALFHLLRGEPQHAALARDILRSYAERYLEYPNQDNVLGPTRLFFSTYLESIWLLQICVAADLLAESGDRATVELVRDRIIMPSSTLIASFDEGMSNRQVWNNAAMLAAAAHRDDRAAIDRLANGPTGLRAHLTQALLADGTWYEGENYHQFALRGLWYGVTICETRGVSLDDALADRFRRAFATPFVTALPDFTMPSRKDSRYAVSLRQWRVAELTELGFARSADPVLAGALARCYESGHERRDTGRERSTADVERNAPSSLLTRADLSWRALLHALPQLPALEESVPRSALLEEQGIAVFRRPDDVYVGVDYGQSGGGHGHPDRLNLVLSQGATRWLDDLGTGSYVDPTLHWYRSTLAHNAPLLDGHSQPLLDGVLCAHDEREAMGWIVAELSLPELDVRLQRAVVVAPDYVIDDLSWRASAGTRIELPWHLDATAEGLTMDPASLDGGDGLEDGFAFARDVRMTRMVSNGPIHLDAKRQDRHLRAVISASVDATLYAGCGPGQPSSETRPFYVLRANVPTGSFRAVLAWSDDVIAMSISDAQITIAFASGERHVHRRDKHGWHVERIAGAARRSIDLSGFRDPPRVRQSAPPAARAPSVLRRSADVDGFLSNPRARQSEEQLVFELSEAHYRRSEDTWREAGEPRATIAFRATTARLIMLAHISAGDLRFLDADAANPFDNERADSMGAGVQLYVRTPDDGGGWMLVPESTSGQVRVRRIGGWGDVADPIASWRASPEGYEMRVELPYDSAGLAGYPIGVDVLVNETTAARTRRRGQLVLSGAAGEFVYLRGDRHEVSRLIPLVIVS